MPVREGGGPGGNGWHRRAPGGPGYLVDMERRHEMEGWGQCTQALTWKTCLPLDIIQGERDRDGQSVKQIFLAD